MLPNGRHFMATGPMDAFHECDPVIGQNYRVVAKFIDSERSLGKVFKISIEDVLVQGTM